MLTKSELGAAIKSAITKKGITKAELARVMDVKPASVQGWVKNGRIDKTRINVLVAYFSDVVGLEHWGLEGLQGVPNALDATHLTDRLPETPLIREAAAFAQEIIDAAQAGRLSIPNIRAMSALMRSFIGK